MYVLVVNYVYIQDYTGYMRDDDDDECMRERTSKKNFFEMLKCGKYSVGRQANSQHELILVIFIFRAKL